MTPLGLHPSATRFPDLEKNHALFLDIDGTLAEFNVAPEAAFIPADILAAIDAIGAQLGNAVAVISGRSMEDIDAMCGARVLAAAGQHGLELRNANGTTRASDTAAALAGMREKILELQTRYPALLVEHKGLSMAVHYRHAPHLQNITQQAMAGFMTEQPHLRLIHGKMVSEVALHNANKGEAIRELMKEAPFAGRVPIFLGDDTTDEDGFLAVNEMGGLSGKVGRGKTAAFYRFRDMTEVRDWLIASATRLQAPDIA